jgi:hypothetical protein
MNPIQTRLASFLVVLAAAFAAACDAGPSSTGAVLVDVRTQALSTADVARVTVTISGPGISPDIVATLTAGAASGWSSLVAGIPAGPDRRFSVVATNANGDVLYAGTASGVTITKGVEAFVLIVLQQVTPPVPFDNAAPRFRSLRVSKTSVMTGDTVQLVADAIDPNPGDALTYGWTATGGSFDAPAAPATTWTAPSQPGTYTLTVTARDPKQATASASVTITVAPATGGAQVGVTLNTWPQIGSIVPDPSRVDVGESTHLLLAASDADADALSFTWTAGCEGSFTDAHAPQPSFTLTALAAGGGCTLTVAVSDGRGGSTQGSITVETGPPIVPVVGDGSGGGGGGGGGGGSSVTCRLFAADATLAASLVGGTLVGADGAAIGRIGAAISYFADGAVAGWLAGGTIYLGDGSVRAFVRGSRIYEADGTVLVDVGATIRNADGTIAGTTDCSATTTSLVVALFGLLAA